VQDGTWPRSGWSLCDPPRFRRSTLAVRGAAATTPGERGTQEQTQEQAASTERMAHRSISRGDRDRCIARRQHQPTGRWSTSSIRLRYRSVKSEMPTCGLSVGRLSRQVPKIDGVTTLLSIKSAMKHH
jgi:hypothetical protein